MRNREVDKLLEPAITLIQEHLQINNSPIPKEYESAVASFGAAIIQTGPVPACALYLKSSRSAVDKSRIVFILMNLIQKQGGFENVEILRPGNGETDDLNINWLEQVIDENESFAKDLFKHRLFASVIAVKLALRTFKLEKNT